MLIFSIVTHRMRNEKQASQRGDKGERDGGGGVGGGDLIEDNINHLGKAMSSKNNSAHT